MRIIEFNNSDTANDPDSYREAPEGIMSQFYTVYTGYRYDNAYRTEWLWLPTDPSEATGKDTTIREQLALVDTAGAGEVLQSARHQNLLQIAVY